MELKLTPMLDTIRAQDKELARLRDAMVDIEELVDGYVDITPTTAVAARCGTRQ
jgi:hypothetical protein